MKHFRATLPLALTLILAACAPALTSKEQAVRITPNPEAVSGCTVVGEVVSRDNRGGAFFQGAAEQGAIDGLKREAYSKGADTVLVSTVNTGFGGSNARGEAYRCGS